MRSLRARWNRGEPPGLVLAGYSSGTRNALYPDLERAAPPSGVVFLGPVPQQHLARLYAHAESLVFASLYEGFGLPPLEAMAVGTPVIAVPVSAMPEVCGDGASSPTASPLMRFAAPWNTSPPALSFATICANGDTSAVRDYRWEKTARATFEAYRSAILHPSDRSLCLRRSLRAAIVDWSMKNSRQCGNATNPPGVRESWHGLKTSLHARLRREIIRFCPPRCR